MRRLDRIASAAQAVAASAACYDLVVTDDERWTEVLVSVDPSLVELVADVLWQHGPAAVEEQPSGRSVTLRAGFGDAGDASAAAAAVRARPEAAGRTVAVRTIATDEVDAGLDGWRAWARPVRAGAFLVIPAWLDGTDVEEQLDLGDELDPERTGPPDAVHRLVIDPGRTFGSGSHLSTRLVLARLPALVRPGDRVLDVGCGSGILAVAAAVLGAAEVVGIDIEPAAPEVTGRNAVANGVGGLVRATTDTAAEVAAAERAAGRPGFDVVAANLLGPIIVELAGPIVDLVAPGGAVVLSGLLERAWIEPIDALRRAGPRRFSLERVDAEDGWVAVTLRARAEPAEARSPGRADRRDA